MSDRRDVARNRKAIWQAYLDAAEEKPHGKVTVKDIITRADVSRGTFYAYYKSAEDLRSQIIHEFLQMMLELNRFSIVTLTKAPYECTLNILRSFARNKRMVNALTSNGSDVSLFEEWRNSMYRLILKNEEAGDKDEMQVRAFCLASLITDNCRETACGHKRISVEKRASVVSEFISAEK